MTDMEAKARELWLKMNDDDYEGGVSFEMTLAQALTEAHREGMEEAQNPCVQPGCTLPAHTFCQKHANALFNLGMEEATKLVCGWCAKGDKPVLQMDGFNTHPNFDHCKATAILEKIKK